MSDSNKNDRASDIPSEDSESDVARTFDLNHTFVAGSYLPANAGSEDAVQKHSPEDEKKKPSNSDDSGDESAPDNFVTIAPAPDLTAAQSVGQTRPDSGPASDAGSEDESVDITMVLAGQSNTPAAQSMASADQFDQPDEFLTATNAGQLSDQRLGRYEIRRLLGEGAFGKVFEARDPQLDRIVALKVAKSIADENHLKRFTREARAAAQLRHPHIIPVYEYGQIEDQSYIVYEFVDGETLKFKTERLGQLTFDSAVDIVREIAEGLDYAHEQGIIHRDMKPDNVMIDPKGGIHIADFGCARSENDQVDLTVDGSILGTPVFMSPEQASGKSNTADGRTDIWSLGVMFYELLSGQLPFSGTLSELLYWICNKDPKQLRKIDPTIPIDLETICNRCLNRDLNKRFLTAGELAEELTRFQQGEPIKSRRIGPIERSWMWAKRNRTVASLITAVVTVLLLGTVISLTYAFQLQRKQNQLVETQISLLNKSKPNALPGIFDSLSKFHQSEYITKELDGELENLDDQSDSSQKFTLDQRRFRINMALLAIAKNEEVPGPTSAERPNLNRDVDRLLDQMLEQNGNPEFFQVCCGLLDFQKDRLKGKLWKIVENEDTTKHQRFCAAVALANYDPESEEWKNAKGLSTDLVNDLTSLNQIEMARWLPSVEKIRDTLRDPLLKSFKNTLPEQEIEANRAAVTLSRLYKDRPKWLVQNLLPDATPIQVSYVVDALRINQNQAVDHIKTWLSYETIREKANSLVGWASTITRQANMVVALIELDPDYEWEHLDWSEDPSLAAEIIERIGPSSTSFDILLQRLKLWKPETLGPADDEIAGILLALGGFRQHQISTGSKNDIKPVLLDLFKKHPSARVHSSSKWLLGRLGNRLGWDKDIEAAELRLRKKLPDDDKSWHVDRLGNTFIVFDPVPKFQMGLDKAFEFAGVDYREFVSELPPHLMKIPRRFGVCTTEVTIGQYEEFEEYLIADIPRWVNKMKKNLPGLKKKQENSETLDPANEKLIQVYEKLVGQLPQTLKNIKSTRKHRDGKANKNLPIAHVNFLSALAYCRWVNDQEGTISSSLPDIRNFIAWYILKSTDNVGFTGSTVESPVPDGYRLPSVAEWEYACRGKSRTLYPFGRLERHLEKYAWYVLNAKNSTVQSVGQLKPLSTGIFDMLGNVGEWCLDFYIEDLPSTAKPGEFETASLFVDHGDEFFIEESETKIRFPFGKANTREFRGGSYQDKPIGVRPTARGSSYATNSQFNLGFRLARTYPPKSNE